MGLEARWSPSATGGRVPACMRKRDLKRSVFICHRGLQHVFLGEPQDLRGEQTQWGWQGALQGAGATPPCLLRHSPLPPPAEGRAPRLQPTLPGSSWPGQAVWPRRSRGSHAERLHTQHQHREPAPAWLLMTSRVAFRLGLGLAGPGGAGPCNGGGGEAGRGLRAGRCWDKLQAGRPDGHQ